MRRSSLLVAGLCAAAAMICAAAGFAVAAGDDAGATSGLAMAAQVEPRDRGTTTAVPIITPAPQVVTAPELPTTEAPPVPPPGLTDQAAPTEPAPAPAEPPAAGPEPAPAPAAPTPEPGPAPPAEAAVQPPYSTVLGWHGEGRVAYLTFDDGPGPYTGRILDILALAGVKATFCQVGQKVTENPIITQRVVAEGHTLCNHSWDHPAPFDALPAESLDQQIASTQNAFLHATGVSVRYFRAPEGRFGNPGGAVLQAAQRARTHPLGWGVDSLDWQKPGAPAIISAVLEKVSPGAIILLHDGGGADREQTLAALPGIISGLQSGGYSLVALPPDPAG